MTDKRVHERRVTGHMSGRMEFHETCVCGKPWPCPEAQQFPRPSWLVMHQAREASRDKQHVYLQITGWKYSSSNPSCYWLWEKEMDGRVFLCTTDIACSIQEHLDSLVLEPNEDEMVEG